MKLKVLSDLQVQIVVRQFKKDQDRMITLLVFFFLDEVVFVSSGPCGEKKVSTANTQSELRH